jgi:hypothetical protein
MSVFLAVQQIGLVQIGEEPVRASADATMVCLPNIMFFLSHKFENAKYKTQGRQTKINATPKPDKGGGGKGGGGKM